MKTSFLILLFTCILINFCYASFNLDSLEKQLLVLKQDTNRVNTLNNLCWNYIPIDINKSKTFCTEAIVLGSKLNYKKGLAKASILMSSIYYEQANYPKCLDYNLQALKLREELGDQWGIAGANGNIGTVYQIMKRYDRALEYHKKALVMFQKLNEQNPNDDNEFSIAGCFESIAIVYQETGKQKEAMKYLINAMNIYKRLNYKPNIISCMNNMGALLHELNKDKEALKFHTSALNISLSIGDKKAESDACKHIANIYVTSNNPEKAIIFANKSLSIAKKLSLKENISMNYQLLSQAFYMNDDFKKAYDYLKLNSDVKDSVFNENSSKLITEMQAKYETEKKEQQISLLNKEKEVQSLELNKQRIIIWSVIGGLLLVLVFAFIIFRSLHITRKQKRIIEFQKHIVDEKNIQLNQQNEEITSQRDEIESQRDEITAQRDLVTKHKNHLEETHELLTSSIRYAERIQHAMLPSNEIEDMLLGNHFIFFKPRDIVSGDFYWTIIKRNYLYIAVADCTGHGVPGALMSMLGISFLNEIIAQSEFNTTSSILNKLREHIIKSLQQREISDNHSTDIRRVQDGMDMSLIALNLENNMLQFSGANNSCYIIKNTPVKMSKDADNVANRLSDPVMMTNNFVELNGDKMPIAIYENMSKFKNHDVQLNPNDLVYLFSDGFPDQFGGPAGKKFMYKQFKNILLQNCNKSMSEQKNMLEATLNEWQGNNEQTDDITILGFKIT